MNIEHTAETLGNSTVWHTYTSGVFTMIVLDRRESESSAPSHVNMSVADESLIEVSAIEELGLDDPDYTIVTWVKNKSRGFYDLDDVINDATAARDVIHDFRQILLTNHQITTTLNKK